MWKTPQLLFSRRQGQENFQDFRSSIGDCKGSRRGSSEGAEVVPSREMGYGVAAFRLRQRPPGRACCGGQREAAGRRSGEQTLEAARERLAQGLAVMADFVAAGERPAMRRAPDCSCSGQCAAMHSAGGASSNCAAAATASLGTAPPAAPPGVEARGFAFSSCAAAGSSGTPAPAAAASAAAGAPAGPWSPGPASQRRCTLQTVVDPERSLRVSPVRT